MRARYEIPYVPVLYWWSAFYKGAIRHWWATLEWVPSRFQPCRWRFTPANQLVFLDSAGMVTYVPVWVALPSLFFKWFFPSNFGKFSNHSGTHGWRWRRASGSDESNKYGKRKIAHGLSENRHQNDADSDTQQFYDLITQRLSEIQVMSAVTEDNFIIISPQAQDILQSYFIASRKESVVVAMQCSTQPFSITDHILIRWGSPALPASWESMSCWLQMHNYFQTIDLLSNTLGSI